MHKYILVVLGMNYSKLSSNLKISHIGHTLQSSKVMRYNIWSGGSIIKQNEKREEAYRSTRFQRAHQNTLDSFNINKRLP